MDSNLLKKITLVVLFLITASYSYAIVDVSKITIKEYMANVENRRLLQAGLPPEAILIHKTGDIGKMLGDAGVVYAQNGRKYIVVILVKRPHNDYSARDMIQEASRIIYKNINSGIDVM